MATRINGFSSASSTGSGASTGKPGRREPFPHIDDLTSVAVDFDFHTPLKKVLEIGEIHMRQAITFNEFRRPDLALQEYIKAFTVAVDKVPKHKDYPSLKIGRGDLVRQYNALKVSITTNGNKFDKIKEDIKEDNRRSGVQPKSSASDGTLLNLPNVPSALPQDATNNGVNGLHGARSPLARARQSTTNGTASRAGEPYDIGGKGALTQKSKPAIHPKPQALHGNALKSAANPAAQDLAARFARLRDPQDVAKRMTAAVTAKPAGPRELSSAGRSQPTMGSAMPLMPKLPDAIYSPARGTITSEVADLPSSTPRGMFSRTNSIASTTSTSARNSIDVNARPLAGDQFVFAPSLGNSSAPPPVSPRMQISNAATITPEQLQEYMQKGASVVRLLLIDVRSREEFDDGHILSQATICVEPAVLARGDVSAANIEESLGIAPDDEMKAFESRGQFDLIVFYDQDSTSIPQRPSQQEQESAIFTLHQALVLYDFGGELRHGPKLLEGGVDAWVDLFGPRSLQESKTSATIQNGQGHGRQVRPGIGNRRRSRAQTKALKPEEIKQFQDSLATPPLEYVRSKEEFLRRYPPAADIPRESMTSAERVPHHTNSGFESDLPPIPPARPAPAVPRTSYSGLSSKEPASGVVYTKSGRLTGVAKTGPTGLVNDSQNCFANSAIQVILFSPGFAAEFTKQEWPGNWLPGSPSVTGAKNPQLMARIMGNLIQWLAGRQFPTLRPTTLLNYSRSIHTGYLNSSGKRLCFGDGNQHDSSEYLLEFIFDQLDIETNRKSNVKQLNYQAPGEDFKVANPKAPRIPVLDLAMEAWRRYAACHESILTPHWTLSFVTSTICSTCSDTVDSFGMGNSLDLGLKEYHPRDPDSYATIDIKDILKQLFCTTEILKAEGVKGFDCGVDVGERHMDKTKITKLARLPPLLCFRLMRFEAGKSNKNSRHVKFDINNLDLTKYTIDRSGSSSASPALYDLYAVICHIGESVNGGHYVSYVRDGTTEGQWYECNDEKIYAREIGKRADPANYRGSNYEPIEKTWFECIGRSTPFILFYKRKDIPWEYPKPQAL